MLLYHLALVCRFGYMVLLDSFHGKSFPPCCLQKMAEGSSQISSTFIQPSKDEVVARLQQTDATDMLAGLPHFPDSKLQAAVLVPLFYRNNILHTLLTVRSSHLKSYQGEVAFPGGKCDEGDTDFRDTALRETEEEIGLPRNKVHVISQLGPAIVRQGMLVVPVVGFIPEDFIPVPNPTEVQEVFCVPLMNFLQTENHVLRVWKDMSGHKYNLHFFGHSDGTTTFTIFGFTARLCILAAMVCFARSPDFECDLPFDSTNPKKILEPSQASYMRHVTQLSEPNKKHKL